MTPSDSISYARDVVGKDPVATHLGIVVEEVEAGRAVVSLVPQAHHLNAVGRVHGTIVYALADQAVAVAANSLGGSALHFESRINFLAGGAPDQKLTATALPLDLKRKLSLWEVKVTAPDGGLVALAQSMAYHQSKG